jgi:hypothetical protein
VTDPLSPIVGYVLEMNDGKGDSLQLYSTDNSPDVLAFLKTNSKMTNCIVSVSML